MRKKILIALDIKTDARALSAILNRLSEHEVKCVALAYDVADQLERARLRHEFRECAANCSILKKVNEYARDLSSTWFQLKELQEYIEYQGINLGRLVALDMLFAFNVLLDRWLNIREVVCQWAPDEIINVYLESEITDLRLRSDESALPSILEMLRSEFPTLTVRQIAIKRRSNACTLLNRLMSSLKRLFYFLAAEMIVPLVLALHHFWCVLVRRRVKGGVRIAFYSGWWHFLPVILHLVKECNVEITLIQRSFGRRILRQVLPLTVRLERLSLSSCARPNLELWQRMQVLMQNESVKERFVLEGICVWPLLQHRFKFFWASKLGELTLIVSEVVRQLKKISPHVVVAENDTITMERTVVTVANRLGMKTVVLQHGMTSGGKSSKGFLDHAFLPLTASYIGVFGKITRDFFIDKGVAESRVKMVGCPRFDRYFTAMDKPYDDSFLKRYGVPENRKIVLFANTPWYQSVYNTGYSLRFSESARLIKSVVQAIDQIPGAHLIIKMKDVNLKDQIDVMDQQFGLYDRHNVSVLFDVDIPKLLKRIDLLIGSWTTMCLEALIFDCPVMIVNLTGRLDPMPFVEMKGAIGVYDEAGIYPMINKMLYDESFRRQNRDNRTNFVRNYLISCRGDGAHRFGDLLLELAANGRSYEPGGEVGAGDRCQHM